METNNRTPREFLKYFPNSKPVLVFDRVTGESWEFRKGIDDLAPPNHLNDMKRRVQIENLTSRTVDLEISGACNAECVFCPRETLRKGRGVGLMKPEMFYRIADELADVAKFVGFVGIGEPTIHPKLPDFIEYLVNRGVECGLVTNGSKLEPELNHRLIESGLKFVQISFTGTSRETYERQMKHLNFDDVVRSVEEFSREAAGRVAVSVAGVQTGENIEEMENFRGFWNSRGVHATMTPCHSRGGTVGTDLVIAGPKSDHSSAMLEAERCGLFNSRLFICWDGRALSCCHDITGSTVLGDFSRESLRAILQKKAKAVAEGPAWEICRNCDEPARRLKFSSTQF